MDYLIVVSAPARRLSATRFAMDGAFAAHLRAFMKHLSPRFSRVVMAAPELPAESYDAVKASFSVIDELEEPIVFVPSYGLASGALRAALRIPGLVGLVRRSEFVHTHLSELPYPHPAAAGLLAFLFKKRTMLVSDLDDRGFAERERLAGRIGLREYAWRRYVAEPWNALQKRVFVRHADLVLYKEHQQAEDFGGGAPHVRFFLDPHFEAHEVISPEHLQEKIARLENPVEPLRVLFFGRLVAGKGVDVMIEAVASAKRAGSRLTFDVMGAGPDEERLRHLAQSHGLEVRWLAPRPYAEGFLDVVRDYDLLLACPRVADTARSAWDAIASGLCVLAYDTRYYRRVAELTSAVITSPEHDVRAFTDRLVGLSANKASLVPKIERGVEVARENAADVWLRRRASWIHALFEPAPERPAAGTNVPEFLGAHSPCGPASREHV